MPKSRNTSVQTYYKTFKGTSQGKDLNKEFAVAQLAALSISGIDCISTASLKLYLSLIMTLLFSSIIMLTCPSVVFKL